MHDYALNEQERRALLDSEGWRCFEHFGLSQEEIDLLLTPIPGRPEFLDSIGRFDIRKFEAILRSGDFRREDALGAFSCSAERSPWAGTLRAEGANAVRIPGTELELVPVIRCPSCGTKVDMDAYLRLCREPKRDIRFHCLHAQLRHEARFRCPSCGTRYLPVIAVLADGEPSCAVQLLPRLPLIEQIESWIHIKHEADSLSRTAERRNTFDAKDPASPVPELFFDVEIEELNERPDLILNLVLYLGAPNAERFFAGAEIQGPLFSDSESPEPPKRRFCPTMLMHSTQSVFIEKIYKTLPVEITDVFVCDAYIPGIESAEPIAFLSAGFGKTVRIPGSDGSVRDIRVWNIDHHADDPRAERAVSSGNLALEWVRQYGVPDPSSSLIVVNHTDCDSIVTSAILSGRVDYAAHGEALEAAVVAADHTGEALPLAEVLQSLERRLSLRLSWQAMDAALDNKFITWCMQEALKKRLRARDEFRNLLFTNLRFVGDIAVLELDVPCPNLDAAFFPALLGEFREQHEEFPDAALCVLAYPKTDAPGSPLIIKMRLANSGLGQTTSALHLAGSPEQPRLRLNSLPFDPAFGGRWNAGANVRGGGTDLTLEEWLERLQEWRRSLAL